MSKVKGRRKKEKVKAKFFVFLIFAFGLLPFSFSCGKRRPPLPPIERIPQRTEFLSGIQRGNQVILEWPAPRLNAPDENVQSIRRIDVYRLAERLNDPLPLTEEEFAARATVIGTVTAEEITRSTTPRATLTYVDTLSFGRTPSRLRYALRYVNASGQRAAFSNFLLIEPAARISQPPRLIEAQTMSENTIVVRWEAPTANVDNSTPANILGYNIYRSAQRGVDPAQTPLNPSPVNATQFADQNFTFGEEYTYVVRAVSLGAGEAVQVESLNSNIVTVTPRDVFAPSAPASISIAPAPRRLSLFFPANPERDVVGYNVYRSSDPNLPKERWMLLTRAPLTRTTFADESVEPGRRYYYYLTATDAAGNTSPPSEIVSEIVP